MPALRLPAANGGLESFTLSEPRDFPSRPARPFNRVAFAAAHVVADAHADGAPRLEPAIDWEATLAIREHLFALGFGVAEAMDTAQRGQGLDWKASRELIRRSLKHTQSIPDARLACGAGTDQLSPSDRLTRDDVIQAYEEQIELIEGLGGRVILMASRALAACAKSADDYVAVYDRLLRQVREPVILHWLGEMFDPALKGYWGHSDTTEAMQVCLDILTAHADRVDGVKISLLDREAEIAMRRRLPPSVRMYTGDDFHFAELIAGDEHGYSDALLGIFDAIAPAASAALVALADGDTDEYHQILAPTVPLSRHVFQAPTRFYKTGLVFLAWLNGHQDHFVMVGGQQSARSVPHFAELFRLADAAGLLADPELAVRRMQQLLALHGIDG